MISTLIVAAALAFLGAVIIVGALIGCAVLFVARFVAECWSGLTDERGQN